MMNSTQSDLAGHNFFEEIPLCIEVFVKKHPTADTVICMDVDESLTCDMEFN